MCIGFSALDQDILDLIKDNLPEVNKLRIVNGTYTEGKKTFKRIIEKCNNVKVDETRAVLDLGFSQFLTKEIFIWLDEKK